MTGRIGAVAVLLAGCLAGCGSAPGTPTVSVPGSGPVGIPGATITVNLDDRPFKLHLPRQYRSGGTMPLVVLLHGYTSSAADADRYLNLTAESERRGFVYAMPDGTKDPGGKAFWNATAACCDFYHTGVDDSGYLHRLLDMVKSRYGVDPGRVYLIGHSNGAFMAYRMACEHANEITAIVSLAGAVTNDPAQCVPARPVSVLEVHGTADTTIDFNGGSNNGQPYPSVATTLAVWRRLDGCTDAAAPAAPMDLESTLPGPETTVTVYQTGCRGNTQVALWSITNGRHVPSLTAAFTPAVLDFLLARVAPA